MTGEYDLSSPSRFSVGTAGEVGQRLFLLHCEQGATSLTVKVEKQQVAVLASYLARIVREIGRPAALPDDLDFDVDVEPDWVVGTIGVSYDEDADRLIVVVEEVADEDEEGVVARIALTREQAAAFAIRATSLVEAGRPACPLCGLPLDPSGHDCPRTNGHRPPVT
ncbi:MAG: DUF3090 family protein [Acidimicrobiales bacterium]